jgi:galactokinase
MYKLIDGDTHGLNDVDKFINLIKSSSSELSDFFDKQRDIFIARAPGRLDVMGGIADYSGSLVLEMPIAEATLAAVQKRDDQKIRIRSLGSARYEDLLFEISLSDFATLDYDAVRKIFSSNLSSHWAAYVAGVIPALARERGFEFQAGASILIASDVPPGKGVSSSAALEVATMQAICSAFDIAIEPRQAAMLCQKVENLIVGAPCGVMDQVTSHCGVENSLISLLCQPAELNEIIQVPEAIEFWGIDSGVRHAVTGSDYGSVRTGAFMGYRIIAEQVGLSVGRAMDGVVEIDDERWKGYLSNISPAEYESSFSTEIPETILGAEFISRYGGITDKVTKVDPAKTYSVRAPTEFPIYENSRAYRFGELLKSEQVLDHLKLLGELMFESHAGYHACGLTESGTNRIVALVREKCDQGLFGARITGGGSGGTVVVLGTNGTGGVIAEIARQYAAETGREPYIFNGSSPGCAALGNLRLRLESN